MMVSGFARKLHNRTRAATRQKKSAVDNDTERHGASLTTVQIRRPRTIARPDQSNDSSDLVAYWARLRGQRRFPAYSELDRKMISFFWPFSILFKVSDAGKNIEIDSSIDPVSSFRGGLAPATSDGDAPQFALTEWILEVARNAADEGQPVNANTMISGPFEHRNYRGVAVPLGDSDTVDHVLAHYMPVDAVDED